MGRTIRVTVLATVLLVALPAGATAAGGTGAAAAVQARPAVVADFNGDGIDDLVVGVPGEDIGATTNAGAVNVIYGSESGLADGPRQQLTQALAGPATGSARPWPPATSTATSSPTWPSASPARTWAGSPTPARSRSSTAAAASSASRRSATSCCARGRPAWPVWPRPATASAPPWPPGWSTTATRPTWPSGRPARTSAPPAGPGRSAWSTGPPAGCWAAATC